MKYLKLFEDFSDDWDEEDEEDDIMSSIFEISNEEDVALYIKVYKDEFKKFFDNKGIVIDDIEINNVQKFDDEYELTCQYSTMGGDEIEHKRMEKYTEEFERLYFIESFFINDYMIKILFSYDAVVELY